MFQGKKSAFTLVELIVVITIVWILSTIGFVSYSNYLTGARDSNRISQMVKITDSMQVYSATKSLPLPDNKIDITASWASNIIWYQGKVWVDVLEAIDYSNGGEDPKDKNYFTYFLSKDRKSMQILTFLEEPSTSAFINSAYAVDYTDRFPKVYGKKLGVLLSNADATKNTPAEDLGLTTIDVVLTTGSTGSYIAYISDDTQITGTGTLLKEMIPNGSCKRIKETGGGSTNGIYDIQPSGTTEKKAYCNMEEAGGGWTLIARSKSGVTGTLALATATGSVSNLDTLYSLGTSGLLYTKWMFASYISGRSIDNYKTIDTTNVSLSFSPHTLTATGITGGVSNDGYLGKAGGMIFVK